MLMSVWVIAHRFKISCSRTKHPDNAQVVSVSLELCIS